MIWTRARREKCRISGNRWLRGQRWPEANRWKRCKRRLCQPTSPCPPIGQAANSCHGVRRSGPAREFIIVLRSFHGRGSREDGVNVLILSKCNQGVVCESVIALSNLAQHSRRMEVLFIIFSNFFTLSGLGEKRCANSEVPGAECADVESAETCISRTREIRS